MNKIALLICTVLAISFEINGQIKEGGTYQFFTCKDRTENYVYYGGTSDINRIYCGVKWTVTGGVFVDANNATTFDTYTDPSTGISTMRVKWTTDNSTGTVAVTTTNCANGNSSQQINFKTNPTTLTATPNPASAGQLVTLNANPQFTSTSINWSSPAGGNLNASTGQSVTANPTVTTTYTNKVSYNAILQINFQTVKTISCIQTGTIPVNVASGSPVTGNSICCSQCIATGQTPAALGQLSGTTLGGASSFSYQWSKSTNGSTFTPITGATSANYSPGVLSQTTWYKRIVNIASESQPVKITVALDYVTVNAANYSQNTTISALTAISIEGDQTPLLGVTVNYEAGAAILISGSTGSTKLSPSVYLRAGTVCGASNGRMAISEQSQTTTTKHTLTPGDERPSLIEIREFSTDETEFNEISYVVVHPNPADGETIITYKLLTKSPVKLSISNSLGITVLILIENVIMKPGTYQVAFNTKNLGSGLFSYTFKTNDNLQVKKFISR